MPVPPSAQASTPLSPSPQQQLQAFLVDFKTKMNRNPFHCNLLGPPKHSRLHRRTRRRKARTSSSDRNRAGARKYGVASSSSIPFASLSPYLQSTASKVAGSTSCSRDFVRPAAVQTSDATAWESSTRQSVVSEGDEPMNEAASAGDEATLPLPFPEITWCDTNAQPKFDKSSNETINQEQDLASPSGINNVLAFLSGPSVLPFSDFHVDGVTDTLQRSTKRRKCSAQAWDTLQSLDMHLATNHLVLPDGFSHSTASSITTTLEPSPKQTNQSSKRLKRSLGIASNLSELERNCSDEDATLPTATATTARNSEGMAETMGCLTLGSEMALAKEDFLYSQQAVHGPQDIAFTIVA